MGGKEQSIHNKKRRKKIILALFCVIVCLLVVFVIAAIAIPIGIWLGVSSYAYNRMFLCGKANSNCFKEGVFDRSTLVPFSDCSNCFPNGYSFNMTKYQVNMSQIIDVQFPPRDDPEWTRNKMGNLTAWIWDYDGFTNAPTVIVVHGIKGCKSLCTTMLPSAMLHLRGYNILAIDLRNHGHSPEYDPPYAQFGNSEYRDVLGAVDFLEQTYGSHVLDRLGIIGLSMGGAVSLIAFEKEARFKAIFLDSAAVDVYSTLKYGVDQVLSAGKSVMYGTCVLKKKKYGCAPFSNDPLKGIGGVGNRPIHFDHCLEDRLVPSFVVETAIKRLIESETDSQYITYYIEKSGWPDMCLNHIMHMRANPDAYEQRLLGFFDKHL